MSDNNELDIQPEMAAVKDTKLEIDDDCDDCDDGGDDCDDCDDDCDDGGDDDCDNNIPELCETIFTKRPGPPCSWCLYLDEQIDVPENEQGPFTFDILVQILFGGIKILFGVTEDNKISLSSITESQFELLRDYFKMIEYDIVLEIYDIDEKPEYPEYNGKDFSTLHLKFLKQVIKKVPELVEALPNVNLHSLGAGAAAPPVPVDPAVPVFVDIHFVPYKHTVPLHIQANKLW